jgi:hypothetical protein
MLSIVRNITAQLSKKTFLKLVKNSDGLTPIIIVAIVAVLLAIGGGFYFMSQKNGGSNPLANLTEGNPLAKVTLNPNCKYNDPELCKFMNNMMVKKDQSIKTVSTMGGMNMESLYESSGEDKFRMSSKLNGKENSNMISIGETTYTLDYNDNKWWKVTLKKEELDMKIEESDTGKFEFPDEEVEDKTQYKFIAKEACGNKQCFKYEIVSPEMPEGKQYIWFDDSEYLMRKMRMESKEGTMESTYSYDNVNISVPSPIKEAAPGAAMPTQSEADVKEMMKQYEQQTKQEEPNTDDAPASNSLYDMEQPMDEESTEEYF